MFICHILIFNGSDIRFQNEKNGFNPINHTVNKASCKATMFNQNCHIAITDCAFNILNI